MLYPLLLLAPLIISARSAPPGLITLRFPRVNSEEISGNHQVQEAGLALKRPLVVQAVSAESPIPGVPVRFSVLSEPAENRTYPNRPATLSDTLVLTDHLGLARTTLTLGSAPGEYRIRATGAGTELIFAVRGLARRWYLKAAAGVAGGLVLFLFGLYYGSKGLRRLASGRVREALFSLTRNRLLGLLTGIGVTAVFQSSTAVLGLLLSLAASGLIDLTRALGVILGADIGTTITVQLLSVRIYDYALLVVFLGFFLMNRLDRGRDAGQAVFGFGLVFYSLKLVLEAAEPLRYLPAVQAAFLDAGANPLFSLVFALLLTALLRSSAATIGILVGLSFTGLVRLNTALLFILGAGIGSALTTALAAWRTNTAAQRIALAQLLFKLTIALLCLPFIAPLTRLFSRTGSTLARQIANAHTILNLAAALIFLPLLDLYERLLYRLLPERPATPHRLPRLEPGALDTPELALAPASRELIRMAELVEEMYRASLPVFLHGDKQSCRALAQQDDAVDRLEEELTAYLARISQEPLTPELSRRVFTLFYITDELEHIADIVSKNLTSYARKKINENLAFSPAGLDDIVEFHRAVGENLKLAIACLTTGDRTLAQQLLEKRAWGVRRKRELHNRHLARLARGLKESLDTSTIHLDLIADLERINFHLSQIGAALLGVRTTTAPDEPGPDQTASGEGAAV